MKELGEQWVEVINGQEHMVKEVSALSYGDCNGCFLFTVAGCGKVTDFAPCSSDTIIKDLGILNEDGCLPCPFCEEYPKIIHPTENMPVVSIVHTGVGHRILLEFFSSEQQAIDAWNRRA